MAELDKQKLTSELTELFKKHKKAIPETEMEVAAAEYFTDDKITEMAAGLVDILDRHLKEPEGE